MMTKFEKSMYTSCKVDTFTTTTICPWLKQHIQPPTKSSGTKSHLTRGGRGQGRVLQEWAESAHGLLIAQKIMSFPIAQI